MQKAANPTMSYKARCSTCGDVTADLMDCKCRSCGNPLDVDINFDFKTLKILKDDYSIWRYRSFLPYVKDTDIITLGEGWTPLVRLDNRTHLKLENLNPTGSFKDRGSAALVSAIHKSVKKKRGYVSEDSSGNAGASMAAYAARAGLRAKIYVPETVSGPKFNQTRFYGAEIEKVSGSRNRVAEEAQKPEAEKNYVGHILHPLFRDGMRTLAYEIAEQLSWKVPERVYLPVSAGTLLLGVIRGFKHLADSNVTKAIPEITACQTTQVSPLYHRIKNLKYTPPETVTSVADALVSVNPPLLDLMEKNLKEVNGDAVVVEEAEIMEAFRELARTGFFVEPSSAVAYAGYRQEVAAKKVPKGSSAVIILTGTGFKTMIRPDSHRP